VRHVEVLNVLQGAKRVGGHGVHVRPGQIERLELDEPVHAALRQFQAFRGAPFQIGRVHGELLEAGQPVERVRGYVQQLAPHKRQFLELV